MPEILDFLERLLSVFRGELPLFLDGFEGTLKQFIVLFLLHKRDYVLTLGFHSSLGT